MIVQEIENLIELAEKTKSAYFWHSFSTANQRRRAEDRYSADVRGEFVIDGYKLEIDAYVHLRYSCRYVYRTVGVIINNVRTTMKALRTVVKAAYGKKLPNSFVKRFCM